MWGTLRAFPLASDETFLCSSFYGTVCPINCQINWNLSLCSFHSSMLKRYFPVLPGVRKTVAAFFFSSRFVNLLRKPKGIIRFLIPFFRVDFFRTLFLGVESTEVIAAFLACEL